MREFVLLFPGQGSQYVEMGKKLYDGFASAREIFEQANEALGFDLKKLCFEGDIDELTKTENAQPAILTASVAAFKVYMEQIGIKPVCTAGHSLGEYSALVCSGAINFTDAVRIVRQRGKFMQEAAAQGTGAMAAIRGLSVDTIESECKKASTKENIAVISNYNSSNQTVISGHKQAVEMVVERLEEMDGMVNFLNVSAPFHCPLMQPAAEKLKSEIEKYEFNDLEFPVISNITALPYEGSGAIIKNLTSQLVLPVQWQNSMKYVVNSGIDVAVEVGPGKVLKNLIKGNLANVSCYSFDQSQDVEELLKLKNAEDKSMEEDNGPTVVTRCMAVAVCTPNSNWDNEEYQKGVVEPYKRIQEMQEEIEKNQKKPTLEQMQAALGMLKSIFKTKKTPVKEQIERFNQIFEETKTKTLFWDFEMPVEK